MMVVDNQLSANLFGSRPGSFFSKGLESLAIFMLFKPVSSAHGHSIQILWTFLVSIDWTPATKPTAHIKISSGIVALTSWL